MENKQDCTKVYSIKGYAVQDNGIVRNSYGEYIGQLSDLEECEARWKEIAKLKEQITDLRQENFKVVGDNKSYQSIVANNARCIGELKLYNHNKAVTILELKKQLEEKEAELLKWTSKYTCCNGSTDCANNQTSKFCDYFIGGEWSDKHDELYNFLVENSMKQEFLESDLQAKDELLEKMRVASENLCEWVSDLRNVSNLSPEIIPNVWGRIANCYSSSVRCREALALLSKSLPKPLNKEVKEKGSEE